MANHENGDPNVIPNSEQEDFRRVLRKTAEWFKNATDEEIVALHRKTYERLIAEGEGDSPEVQGMRENLEAAEERLRQKKR
jgi:hypothetical protein